MLSSSEVWFKQNKKRKSQAIHVYGYSLFAIYTGQQKKRRDFKSST